MSPNVWISVRHHPRGTASAGENGPDSPADRAAPEGHQGVAGKALEMGSEGASLRVGGCPGEVLVGRVGTTVRHALKQT